MMIRSVIKAQKLPFPQSKAYGSRIAHLNAFLVNYEEIVDDKYPETYGIIEVNVPVEKLNSYRQVARNLLIEKGIPFSFTVEEVLS